MVGHNSDRFVDLTGNDEVIQELTCGICLNIFNNAVQTNCGHNYCADCLKLLIVTSDDRNDRNVHILCPECRQQIPSCRRRSGNGLVEVVSGFWFERNRTLNNIINKHKVKCDNHLNGCPQVMALESLAAHLKDCQHSLCVKCGLNDDNWEQHDCIEALKTMNNDLSAKCETMKTEMTGIKRKSKEKVTKMKTKVRQLEDKFKTLKNRQRNGLKIGKRVNFGLKYIFFGTFKTNARHLSCVSNVGINIKDVKPNNECNNKYIIFLPFVEICEILYLTDHSLIAILVCNESQLKIKDCLGLDQHFTFDINSNGMSLKII